MKIYDFSIKIIQIRVKNKPTVLTWNSYYCTKYEADSIDCRRTMKPIYYVARHTLGLEFETRLEVLLDIFLDEKFLNKHKA